MPDRIALFWPGDARAKPNELAQPNAEAATRQLEAALARLGRQSYRIPGFISKPHESIERLGPIHDPVIGVCVHWFYGPHTTEGVVGKDHPLLLASNFSGQWPGLVGLLNTGACLELLDRPFSRIWTTAENWTADDEFMLPNAMMSAMDPRTLPTPSRKDRSSCARSIRAISPMNSEASTRDTTELTLNRAMSTTSSSTAIAV